MIKEGLVYDCVDNRPKARLTGVTLLIPVPGGFEVWNLNREAENMQFEEDDQLEIIPNLISFYMPEGKVHFIPLTLEDYNRLGGPSRYGKEFSSTDSLQMYFRTMIEAD